MKKPDIRPITIIYTALGLLVAVLVIAVVNQRIVSAGLSSEIARQKQQLSELTKNSVSHRKLNSDYYRLSTRIGGRFHDVSWDRQMPRMINQLTGIMDAHNIDIEVLKPETIVSNNKISKLPIRISFKSNLEHLTRALLDIEKTTPILNIDQINIRVSDNKTDTLQVDAIVSSFAITDKNVPMQKESPNVTITPEGSSGASQVEVTQVNDYGYERGPQ